jgi:hypothetical protein
MNSKNHIKHEYASLDCVEGNEDEQSIDIVIRPHLPWHSTVFRSALYLVIGASLLLNMVLFIRWIDKNRATVLGDRSVTAYGMWRYHLSKTCYLNTKAARLSWNTPGEFEHNGIYDSINSTLTEESWANLSYDLGSIALSDEYAESVGLPTAQRFPWDDAKGLYFLNGYHGIHCLVCSA